ncbi:Fic family protein [Thalassospira mesophila]|uniref:Cell filamentation protein Fic n=1 Tax=Thalassospira mesophila TaxID=1293891 RepID=A0A1Y2L063_9PROT|nr:Fic family protein [Thalassospira mesophila]OSQ38473.1 cell filamentation protein Fic [Thalassospira mesophila]
MQLEIGDTRYFQDEPIPAETRLAGWSALVHALGLQTPVRHLSCISEKYVRGTRRYDGRWEIYDKRFALEDTLADHLGFALRHEKIDLLILKRLFDAIDPGDLAAFIRSTPNGAVTRRAWFFYETLTGNKLELDDAPLVKAVNALDPSLYFTGKAKLSVRHRVWDNLLGTGEFCPVIRRTKKLEEFIDANLSEQAAGTIGRTGTNIVARAASFLLLADSRASFEIEGERPRTERLQRWGRAVLEAGKRPLNQTEIYRLHRILIGDDRFTAIGYRTEGVFLGERDINNDPVPEFIGARHSDVFTLMTALNGCNNRLRPSNLDAVLQAAIIAFGFIYIHPLADGNGRLHRCLIHHVLAERKFTPPGMVFPVSSVMLDRIDDYRKTLQAHSGPLMDFIEWRPLPNRNVDVINDTADLYRYFDCTEEAEFLYSCVKRTVDYDLPKEIIYLKSNDEALRGIMSVIEMPDRLAQDLIMHIRQNNGKLSKNRRQGIFEELLDQEVAKAEEIVSSAFEDHDAEFGERA